MSEKFDEEITVEQQIGVKKLSDRVDGIIRYIITLNKYKKAVFDILDSSYKYEHFDTCLDFTNFKYELESLPYYRFMGPLCFNHELPSNISELLRETRMEIVNTVEMSGHPEEPNHEKIFRNIDKFVFRKLVKLYDAITKKNKKSFHDVEIVDLFNVEEEHVPFVFKDAWEYGKALCESKDSAMLQGKRLSTVCNPKKYLLYGDYLHLINEFYKYAKLIYEKVSFLKKIDVKNTNTLFCSIIRVSNVIEFTVNHYQFSNEDVIGFINSQLNDYYINNNTKRFNETIDALVSFYHNDSGYHYKCLPSDFICWYDTRERCEINYSNYKVKLEICKKEIISEQLSNLMISNAENWEDSQTKAERNSKSPERIAYDVIVNKLKDINKNRIDEINKNKEKYLNELLHTLRLNIIKLETTIDYIENEDDNDELMTKPFIKHIDEYIKEQMDRLNCNDTCEFMKEISGYVSESEFGSIYQSMIQNVRTLERLQNIVTEIKEKAKDEETKKEQSTGSA